MRKGSITTYVSLILLVLFSLIAAGLYSARQAAGRVMLASGTEQALFSLFGQYDLDLFEQYGLLFLDGGYGGSELQSGRLLEETETAADYIFRPVVPGFSRDPIGIRIKKDSDSITGYVLATDNGGRAFRRQVCEIMQKKLGPAGLLFLQGRLEGEQQQIDTQEAEYEALSAEAQEVSVPEVPLEGIPADGEETVTVEIPDDFFDPFAAVRSMRAAGVLAMVFPQAASISAGETDPAALVSGRQLQSGMNMPADGWEGNGEKLLLLEYLAERFPCYTSEYAGGGLRYQIEYAIAGKSSDRANLQETLLRLLHIREAANFLHILRDPAMRSRAEMLAEIISLLVLNPELEPVIAAAVEVAWAYGESIMDLRELMAGGRVPLVKDAASWQLPLSGLPFLRGYGASGHHNADGLDYGAYLRILLFLKSADSLAGSLMDLTELNIREAGRPAFRMDCCIDALRVELHASVGRNTYQTERSYGYNA